MSEKRNYLDSLRTALMGFELNEAETAVYAATLQLGTRQASKIAKAAGLNRAYTYDILASLKDKGLVQEGIRNKVRHYTCTPTEHLVALLEQREREVASHRHTLEKAMPQLVALQSQFTTGGNGNNYVRWFQGADASDSLIESIGKTATGVVRCALSGEALEPASLKRMMLHLDARDEVEEIKVLSFGTAFEGSRQQKQQTRRASLPFDHLDLVLANEALHVFVAEPKPLSLVVKHQSLQFSATQLFETAWLGAG